MARTTWPEFWQMLSFMKKGEGEDPLGRARDIAGLESTGLDIQRKRRELAGPSPGVKYQEEQRSKQIGSALEMFGTLYKTASPASKKRLGEQMTNLWGLMNPADKTKFEMLVSHTPINPKVQKSMWFEEVNPRPRMPIIKEGDGTWTNVPPRTPEYRNMWAEFDITSDEWDTLRKMAVEGKTAKEANWKSLPRFYDSDDANIRYYRDPIDKRIKEFNFKNVDQAKMATAVEKGWTTLDGIMRTGLIPIASPREINFNGTLVTSTQEEDLRTGGTRLTYKPLGPLDESKLTPSDSLRDAANFATGDINPRGLKILNKDAATLNYYDTLQSILGSRGEERASRLQFFQDNLVATQPDPLKRFIPFVSKGVARPTFWEAVFDWVPFVDFESIEGGKMGVEQGIILRQADKMVTFFDLKGVQGDVWWSDVSGIAYYADGSIIKESKGMPEGSQLNITWGK